ncbi:hypothetical protein F2Q70_00004727 [Brassica cretica]|nr:hypothetical protein F2Q70_00004727 [Brassica cretica]
MDNTDRRRRRKQHKATLHDSEGPLSIPYIILTWYFTCLHNCSWVAHLGSSICHRPQILPLRALVENNANEHAVLKVSSIEWEFINMTEQEEDLIFRMHRLVGDR